MDRILDSPFTIFVISLIAQGIAAYVGDFLRGRGRPVREDEGEDLAIVETAVLTLLALIIGFSFSMAVTRYDQRKNYEEAEANAIGTEYVRADFLPTENAAGVRELLRNYLDRRVAFYLRRDDYQTGQANAEIAKLQNALWAGILPAANAQPSPVIALAVSGMNDVFNSQSRTQAAWWNRIPGGSVGVDGINRNLLQSAAWLWRAPQRRASAPCPTATCVNFVLANRRYRQPARRGHSGTAAQPDFAVRSLEMR